MSWEEYFVYGYNNTVLPAGVGTAPVSTVIRIDSEADFLMHKICYVARFANIRLRWMSDALGRYFIRDLTDLRAIAGNFIGTPFILPRPLLLPAGTNLTVEAADASGLANSLRIAFHGAKIRPGECPWGTKQKGQNGYDMRKWNAVLPFPYTTQSQTLAAGATSTVRIEVDTDSHFLVQKITGVAQGDCLVDITESASGRAWMNTAVNFGSISGNGQFPNVLFANRFIYRGSVVSINVQDLSGLANNFEIILWGSKLYE